MVRYVMQPILEITRANAISGRPLKSTIHTLAVQCGGYCRYRKHENGSRSPTMRVVIIGGSGHIGSYLTPRLIESGHSVFCVTRGQRQPYVAHSAWKRVAAVVLDRAAEEAAGTFGSKIRDLGPD